MNPDVGDDEGIFMKLSGKFVLPTYFKQWHEFTIVPHHFLLLMGIGVTSLIAAASIWQAREVLLAHLVIVRWLFAVWLFFLYLAWRWFWERWILRKEGVGIGTFSVSRSRQPLMLEVRYNFKDSNDEHYGGHAGSLFCDRTDDLTIVFYDQGDPAQSVPAAAMIFHKLIWQPDREEPMGRAEMKQSS